MNQLPDHSPPYIPRPAGPGVITVTFSKEPKRPPSVNKGTIGKLLKQWKKKKERHAIP